MNTQNSYVDTEMTIDEHDEAWMRMITRAGIQKPELSKLILWMNLRSQTPEERKQTIETTLQNNPQIGLGTNLWRG